MKKVNVDSLVIRLTLRLMDRFLCSQVGCVGKDKDVCYCHEAAELAEIEVVKHLDKENIADKPIPSPVANIKPSEMRFIGREIKKNQARGMVIYLSAARGD